MKGGGGFEVETAERLGQLKLSCESSASAEQVECLLSLLGEGRQEGEGDLDHSHR